MGEFILIGYSDSDIDGDNETGVSTSGYAMSIGSRLSPGEHANNQFQHITQ